MTAEELRRMNVERERAVEHVRSAFEEMLGQSPRMAYLFAAQLRYVADELAERAERARERRVS